MANFQLRALRQAARILGGEERLRALLDAPPGAFSRWMQGAEPLPAEVFLMIVDFLSDIERGVAPLAPDAEKLPARKS